jgi:hypothetical protein
MSNDKIKTKLPDKGLQDKNLQDDWMPDSTRRPGATSEVLPEFGGDLKDKESIEKDSKK